MARSSKSKNIGELTRSLFQDLLREHVKTSADRRKLASVLGVSESTIKGMLYNGSGGLDTWVNALAHFYPINESNLRNFNVTLKKDFAVSEADKIWFSIKGNEARKQKLAKIAKAVFQIENELD